MALAIENTKLYEHPHAISKQLSDNREKERTNTDPKRIDQISQRTTMVLVTDSSS
jgi:hypothetical protein